MAEYELSQRKSALTLKGKLEGHNGWITQLATTHTNPRTLISSSRDKTVMVWDLHDYGGEIVGGRPIKSLVGHGHFVSDVVLSQDGQYALSGSWDKTLRLWDLNTGKTSRQFISHTKDVLSVAFSADNRQIVSGSRDRTVKLWNTLAQCKLTLSDGIANLWDLNDNKHLYQLQGNGVINALAFSPNRYWLCAAIDNVVKIWDLEQKQPMEELKCDVTTGAQPKCTSLAWSSDGNTLFAGYTDNTIRIWGVTESVKSQE